MAAMVPPSALRGISPSRGEIDKVNAPSISTGGGVRCEWRAVPQLISPLEGEMSGRTEGGKRRAQRRQTHAR
ncbi:hypothetical protein P3T31_003586 [Rhizobium sp. AN70]|nr:hypothetical protein [Rhizobium sp. AN70]